MKLYFAPRTRSIRPRWLLEELEVPYTLITVDLSKQEGRTPAHLELHPLGEVPVLVDGDVTLFETSAICLYLADRFPEKHLAPPVASAERGPYLQWLLFAEVTLEPVVLEYLHLAEPLDAQKKAEFPTQPGRLDEVLTAIDKRLHGREFVAGSTFTTADLVLSSILHLAHRLHLLDRYPRILDYVARHTRRPAIRRAVMV